MRDERLHLVYNATSLVPGGGVTGLKGYLEAWAALDLPLRVTVLTSHPSTQAELESTHPRPATLPLMVGKGPGYRMTWLCTFLPRVLRDLKADVVLGTNFAIPRSPVPQVTHHRNLYTLFSEDFGPYLRHSGGLFVQSIWARYALRSSAANVFISSYLRQQAERIEPASRQRNHVVYNGLDARAIALAKRGCSEWDGSSRVLAVQSAQSHKDNGTLIAALAALVRRQPSTRWRLTVAGGGDWAPFRQKARTLGVVDRIEFVGFRSYEELDSLYRQSACLWFTSPFEAFGNPLVEAMARGCPVVAARATAAPEVVDAAGVLVPPGDGEAFAQATAALFEDRERRERLVRAGHARASRFQWVHSARELYEVLVTVAPSPNTGARHGTRRA